MSGVIRRFPVAACDKQASPYTFVQSCSTKKTLIKLIHIIMVWARDKLLLSVGKLDLNGNVKTACCLRVFQWRSR